MAVSQHSNVQSTALLVVSAHIPQDPVVGRQGNTGRGWGTRGLGGSRGACRTGTEKGMQRVGERGHCGSLEKARGKGEQTWGSEKERSSRETLKNAAHLGSRLWGGGREPQLLP